MDQLKPCPFCGGKVDIGRISCGLPGDRTEFWQLHGGHKKDDCKCRIFMESDMFWPEESDGAKEKEELIERWNRRAETNNILQRLETDWDIAKKNYKETGDHYFVGKMDGIDISANRIMTGGKE